MALIVKSYLHIAELYVSILSQWRNYEIRSTYEWLLANTNCVEDEMEVQISVQSSTV
jgi:hypothetical protein